MYNWDEYYVWCATFSAWRDTKGKLIRPARISVTVRSQRTDLSVERVGDFASDQEAAAAISSDPRIAHLSVGGQMVA